MLLLYSVDTNSIVVYLQIIYNDVEIVTEESVWVTWTLPTIVFFTPTPLSRTIATYGLFNRTLLKMFKLDLQGKCGVCLSKARDKTIIQCQICEFSFHAICDSPDGKANPIAKQTHFDLHKQKSTKKNFSWKCDTCFTISEQNQAASVKDMITMLVDRFTQFETQLPEKVKAIVREELNNLDVKHTNNLEELSTKISEKISDPVKTPVTPWTDNARLEGVKSALLVKADKDGNPVNANVVKKIVMDNGVPVNKVVVTDRGDTFINLPDEKSRDKLCPLLKTDTNDVVVLKSKLPAISILGVTDDLTKDEIKLSLCRQNSFLGQLVNEDGEELEVIYTRAPPAGKDYHQVTVRVSPLIRKYIKSQGDRLFLCRKSCKIEDSYHIKRCNHCQKFGHYASSCKEDTPSVCGYCGEGHRSDSCELKDGDRRHYLCYNCKEADLENFKGHCTFDRKCPAYKIQQKKLENSITYLN